MTADRERTMGEGRDEARCHDAGDLLADAFPMPPASAAGRTPAPLLRAQAWAKRPGSRWARWGIALTVAAGFGAALFLVVSRTARIEYQLVGAHIDDNGWFETPRGSNAMVQFSDGTAIALQPRSAGRVKSRTRAGATFQLERGRASFAVVHRPGADWRVDVGPFEIAVTGTEFDVRWADDRGGFEVVMRAGKVVVRGSMTGQGIPLHAGQRLTVSLSRQTLAIDDVDPGLPRVTRSEDASSPAAEPSAPEDTDTTRDRQDHSEQEHPSEERRSRRERHTHDTAPAADERDSRHGSPVPSWSAGTPRPPSRFEPPAFEPAPLPPADDQPPAPQPGSGLRAGGSACTAGPPPQLRFESISEGFRVGAMRPSAFSNPVLDHTHSWCGDGSLRFDATFDVNRHDENHGAPLQVGEAVIALPTPIDLRGKTVTVHFLVQAPFAAEFTARIYAVQVGKRVGTSYSAGLTADQWWTISNTFREPPQSFTTVGSEVGMVDRLMLSIEASGDFRNWSGAVYVDDVSWR